jgi:uncharacterized membrane protein YwzB
MPSVDIFHSGKNREIYAEFVVATVMSILAANLWLDLIRQILPEKNLIILTVTCVLATAATIFLLEYLFSTPKVKN